MARLIVKQFGCTERLLPKLWVSRSVLILVMIIINYYSASRLSIIIWQYEKLEHVSFNLVSCNLYNFAILCIPTVSGASLNVDKYNNVYIDLDCWLNVFLSCLSYPFYWFAHSNENFIHWNFELQIVYARITTSLIIVIFLLVTVTAIAACILVTHISSLYSCIWDRLWKHDCWYIKITLWENIWSRANYITIFLY